MSRAWRQERQLRLVELARRGLTWAAIGAEFYPCSLCPDQAAYAAFRAIASDDDRAARRAALKLTGQNRRGKPHHGYRRRLEPPLRAETSDIFADRGECFK